MFSNQHILNRLNQGITQTNKSQLQRIDQSVSQMVQYENNQYSFSDLIKTDKYYQNQITNPSQQQNKCIGFQNFQENVVQIQTSIQKSKEQITQNNLCFDNDNGNDNQSQLDILKSHILNIQTFAMSQIQSLKLKLQNTQNEKKTLSQKIILLTKQSIQFEMIKQENKLLRNSLKKQIQTNKKLIMSQSQSFIKFKISDKVKQFRQNQLNQSISVEKCLMNKDKCVNLQASKFVNLQENKCVNNQTNKQNIAHNINREIKLPQQIDLKNKF